MAGQFDTSGQGRVGAFEPDELLAEAAAAVASDTQADVLVEAAELLVAEQARMRLADRLRRGAEVRLTTCLGTGVIGHVRAVGPEVVILDESDGSVHAIGLPAIARVSGLGPALRPDDPPRMRVAVSWASWLRRCERVRVTCLDGWQQSAQVLMVGADHVDLQIAADATPTGVVPAIDVVSVPFSALVQATSRGHRPWSWLP